MSTVTVRVPAKINVYLGVGPATADGYHDLATVFQAVSCYDELTVRPAEELSLRITGPWAEQVPSDQRNLAWQAAQQVLTRSGAAGGFDIIIAKSIPVAGGLAGGSADAAAALVGCNEALGVPLTWDELEQAAAQLGSDVPFLLHGGCAVGRGRGTELTPVLTRGNFHWVLATFFTGLSTANIYRDADRLRGADAWPDPVVPQQVLRALSQGDVELLGATLANDLQPAALAARPDLADVLELGRSLGALGGIVSGSGPTCVFLTESEVHSLDLAAALRSSGQVSAALAVHGPVHGARVIPD